jgi:hypothetical protein
MNLFLKRIALFVTFISIILCLIEYSVRQLDNSYKIKTEYLEANSNSIETLILGSSHTYYGVNPNLIESTTFNASNVSQSPDVDLAILKSYEDALNSLSTIVIRLSYDTLFEQLKDSPEDWRLKDYKLYTSIDLEYLFKHNSEILSTGTRQAIRVLKEYYINNKPILNCDSLGWGNDLSKRPQVNLEEVGVIAAKRHTVENWHLLEDNIKIYEQLIAWCQKRKIKVILITPPAYKSYRDHLKKEQLHKMIEIGSRLNNKYNNCIYYNFMSDDSFIVKDFYDADHLNTEGAKKFSSIINSLIEN